MTNLLKRFDEEFPLNAFGNGVDITIRGSIKSFLTTEITTLIERLEGMKAPLDKNAKANEKTNGWSVAGTHNQAIDKAIALLQAEIS